MKQQYFEISGPVGRIEAVVETPEILTENRPIALLCHPHPLMQGTMDNKVVTTVGRAFNQLGLIVVRFNYRGVGKSEGEYGHVDGECADLKAVVAWARLHYPGRDLWLAGFSFGGLIAYRMANELDAKQLLCVAPALITVEIAEPSMPFTVIIPDADEVVSVAKTYSWLNQLKCTYHLIKLAGVSHFFHGQLLVLRDLIVRLYGAQ